jgi:hypothetical protein
VGEITGERREMEKSRACVAVKNEKDLAQSLHLVSLIKRPLPNPLIFFFLLVKIYQLTKLIF